MNSVRATTETAADEAEEGAETEEPLNTLWSAADRGDTEKVRDLLEVGGRDVNGRNCLGCTPLLYACGSGHTETVKIDKIISGGKTKVVHIKVTNFERAI